MILLGVALVAVFLPGDKIEYEADNVEDVVSTNTPQGYDFFEIDANGEITYQLEAANRRGAEEQLGRRYLSESYKACLDIEFVCAEGEDYFFDPYGCGCEKLDFSPEDVVLSENERNESQESVSGEVLVVEYGEKTRLKNEDSIELNGGDVMWLREFDAEVRPPKVYFDIYMAGEDVTYKYPEDKEKLLYQIDLIGSDYKTYVDIVVNKLFLGQTTALNVATSTLLETESTTTTEN